MADAPHSFDWQAMRGRKVHLASKRIARITGRVHRESRFSPNAGEYVDTYKGEVELLEDQRGPTRRFYIGPREARTGLLPADDDDKINDIWYCTKCTVGQLAVCTGKPCYNAMRGLTGPGT